MIILNMDKHTELKNEAIAYYKKVVSTTKNNVEKAKAVSFVKALEEDNVYFVKTKKGEIEMHISNTL